MKYKIEQKYLEQILLGNKNYEIRLNNRGQSSIADVHLGFEYISLVSSQMELNIKIKGKFICKFKDIPLDIMDNIFTSNKISHDKNWYGSDICYDLMLVKEEMKTLKESLALKEMKRFYGDDFNEDDEVIVFMLDN